MGNFATGVLELPQGTSARQDPQCRIFATDLVIVLKALYADIVVYGPNAGSPVIQAGTSLVMVGRDLNYLYYRHFHIQIKVSLNRI